MSTLTYVWMYYANFLVHESRISRYDTFSCGTEQENEHYFYGHVPILQTQMNKRLI